MTDRMQSPRERRNRRGLAVGYAVGTSLGMTAGMLFDSLAAGMIFGGLAGVGLGAAFDPAAFGPVGE